jgi:hypothetical protein
VLGAVTVLWGVILLIWLPDAPATARFLTPSQRVWATQRPQMVQRSFKTNKWSKEQFTEAMLDPKTWFQFWIIAVVSLSNGVIANVSYLLISILIVAPANLYVRKTVQLSYHPRTGL